MTTPHYERIFPALLNGAGEVRPMTPHVVSDVVSVLTYRGHLVSLCSINHRSPSFSLAVDGVPICVRAGDPSDNTTTAEAWFFVMNTQRPNAFVRANVAKTLRDVPFRFEDDGESAMNEIARRWYDVWPKTPSSWEAFARDKLETNATSITERRDLVYMDEHAFANAIEFVMFHC